MADRGINGDPLRTVGGNWYYSSVRMVPPGFGARHNKPMTMGGNPKSRTTFNYTTFVEFTSHGAKPGTCRALYQLKDMSKPQFTLR